MSVFHMGGADVFDFAFRKGERPARHQGSGGKNRPARQRGLAVDLRPDAACGRRRLCPKSIMSRQAGRPGAPPLQPGRATLRLPGRDCELSGRVKALISDYFIGTDFSQLPANSFVIRKSDFEDMSLRGLYTEYLRAWAMGLEFGRINPRAATEIVMNQFPGLATQMTPEVATESMMQLASVFAGRWSERKMWGFHLRSSWQLFFDVGP